MRIAPWRRTAGLHRELLQAWRSSLAEDDGGEARVLAWAPAEDDVCIGSPGALSIGGTTGWRHVPWHTVERGDWSSETQSLSWRDYDGEGGEVRLTPPRRLPDLFRERVAASIVVEKVVPVRGTEGIVCSGRRDLAHPDEPIRWHATPGRGLDWSTPGAAETAEAAMAELRREYDIA